MENREPSFEQSFRECCIRSCNYLAHEREQTDKRYKEVSRECNELYRMIQERLGDEEILLNRFDAAKNHENAINDESIYQQGFQDCVVLLRWIGLL